jgi:GNAT superfamily N-acetyltransferase
MSSPHVRPLTPEDRAAWEPLWAGYQTFYKVQIPPDVTDHTWRRFHDPQAPLFALGAFRGERLIGIVHYLFHESCWTSGPYCYLQDLFTDPAARREGAGRALIEAVYAAARDRRASRVYWLTHETNAEAMALYDKLADRSGFVQYRKILG